MHIIPLTLRRTLLALWLIVPIAVSGCGGGTLTEGVTGPHINDYLISDVTELKTSSDPINTYTGSFYIQAVVNNVFTGDTVTASMRPTGVTKTFTATKDGDVGLLFRFSGPFAAGSYTVTVVHGQDTVGTVNFDVQPF